MAPMGTTTVSHEALVYWINVGLFCWSVLFMHISQPLMKKIVIQTHLLLSEKTLWENSSKAQSIEWYHKQKQTFVSQLPTEWVCRRCWRDTHYCFNGMKECPTWCCRMSKCSSCMCWILLTLSGHQWTVQCGCSANGCCKFDLSDLSLESFLHRSQTGSILNSISVLNVCCNLWGKY